MPRQAKRRTKSTSLALSRIDLFADFQKIHPFIHTHLVTFLRRISSLLGFFAFVLGNTSLVALVLSIQLHNTSLNFALTRPSTAVCLILLGVGILLLNLRRRNIGISIIISFFSLLSFIIAVTCLLSFSPAFQQTVYPHIPFISPDILNFFFHLGPNAAIIIALSSLSLLLAQQEQYIFVSQLFALASILLIVPSNIGYLYGSSFIYSISTNTKLAISTTVGLDAIVFALLLARPANGIMQIVTDLTTGGFFARRFIPIAIFFPLILGWIWLGGYQLHLYAPEFQYLLLVTSTIVVLLVWTIFISRSIQRLDVSRMESQQNIFFLSEASKILSSSLDYRITLRKIADLAVPIFADWCTVEMLNEKNEIRQVAIAHQSSKKKLIGARLLKIISLSHEKGGRHDVLVTGKPVLYPIITNKILAEGMSDKKHLRALQNLHLHSAIIVPITIHRRTIGMVQFIRSESKRSYTSSDLQVAQELTARAALAIENTRLYKNAQDAIKIRDEFISIASHELKTPLTSLKVYAGLLMKKFNKNDPETTNQLQKMDDQITNMTNLIRDLLDVSRIQLGKLTFNFEKMQLGDLVKNIITNYQPTITHKITLQGDITHSITADKERIGQVVLNLLTNAVKYSPEANTVIVRLSQNENSVTVEVQDFGIGIDKKHAQRIFERFYQVGSIKRANIGLGMGLYISKEIIERHGGTISVKSAKGKGSTFAVALPTHPPQLTS